MKMTIATLSLAALLLGTTAAFAGTPKPTPHPASPVASGKKSKKKHHGKRHAKTTTATKAPGK
jgi:hypothetical protein